MKVPFADALRAVTIALLLPLLVACGSPEPSDQTEDALMGEAAAETVGELAEAPERDSEEAAEAQEAAAGAEAPEAEQSSPAGSGCAAFDSEERILPVADLVAAMEDPDCEAGQNITFVDARPQLDYEFGHIPGAISVPYFNAEAYVEELPRDRWLVVYCECPRAEALQVADVLTSEEHGFTQVKIISEGLAGWRDLGLELVSGESSEG